MTSLDFLTTAPPCEVEVSGRPVPIRTGWRRAVRTMRRDPEPTAAELLATWFSRDGEPDRWALAHADDAVDAARRWRDDALSLALPYGERRPSGRIVWDWDADSAIVLADFRRLYGIDLRSWQAHWYDFAALWSALAATEGSLVAEALRARGRAPKGASKWERKAHEAAARAWALPPTEAEAERMALERLRREF